MTKPVVHNPNNLPTIPIADLLPTQGELKDLSETNYNKLKNNIIRRGFIDPVSVWEDSKGLKHLLNGHQRQRVLTKEGWLAPIPYFNIPAKDLQEAAAIVLELTSQYGTITQEGLDAMIATYALEEQDVYGATNFDALNNYSDETETEIEEDEPPDVASEPPVSQLGAVYQLGEHRVMCGDSTKSSDVVLLMDGSQADLVWIDPPYNVDYEGGTGLRIENDKMEDSQFYNFLLDAFTRLEEIMKQGAPIYIAHADSEGRNFRAAMIDSGLLLKQCVIWVKNSMVMGRQDYQWQHEPILYGWKPGAAHKWYGNFDKKTVIDDSREIKDYKKEELIAIVEQALAITSIVRVDKPSKNGEHPTMKPIGLVTKFIWNSSFPRQIVVDTFLGSGSTLIACEQTDRICYGMELDPKYVDVIRKRYAKFTAPDNELPNNWEELTPKVSEESTSG